MTKAMRIYTNRLEKETQGYCDIINPFDTSPTGRGTLRVDGERHTNNLTPCTARGMSRTVNITPKVQDHLERERFQRGLVSLRVVRRLEPRRREVLIQMMGEST